MSFEGFPFIIGWELTLACNLMCRHCGSSAGSPRANELTLKESIAICDQFPDLLVKEVNFTGGEPLLSSTWKSVATYLSKRGVSTKIITNGLLLSKDSAIEIRDLGIAEIGISIDGHENIHDLMRGQTGVFRNVLAGIEYAQSAGLQVSAITTVSALNINALPSLATLMRNIGIRNWQIQPLFPFGRTRLNKDLWLIDEDYIKLGTFVSEYKTRMENAGIQLLPADSFGYYTELDSRDPEWHGCPAGIFSCGITSDGKVKGCLSLPDEFIEGDLRNNDLWEIWFHEYSFSYSRDFSTNMLGYFCNSCDMAQQCRGGCSAMSYASSGAFHNDRYCFYRIKKGSKLL